jgi:hypothetical protein
MGKESVLDCREDQQDRQLTYNETLEVEGAFMQPLLLWKSNEYYTT